MTSVICVLYVQCNAFGRWQNYLTNIIVQISTYIYIYTCFGYLPNYYPKLLTCFFVRLLYKDCY